MTLANKANLLAYANPRAAIPCWRQSPVGIGAVAMALLTPLCHALLWRWPPERDRLRWEVMVALAAGLFILLPLAAFAVAVWSLVRPGERTRYSVIALTVVIAHGWAVVIHVLLAVP